MEILIKKYRKKGGLKKHRSEIIFLHIVDKQVVAHPSLIGRYY
jgi:hypothetical protein